MADMTTFIRDLSADDISVVRRYGSEKELLGLYIGDASIDLSGYRSDQPALIAALERLAELALEVASEIRTGRRDADVPES